MQCHPTVSWPHTQPCSALLRKAKSAEATGFAQGLSQGLRRPFPGSRCGHLFRSFLTGDGGEGDGK